MIVITREIPLSHSLHALWGFSFFPLSILQYEIEWLRKYFFQQLAWFYLSLLHLEDQVRKLNSRFLFSRKWLNIFSFHFNLGLFQDTVKCSRRDFITHFMCRYGYKAYFNGCLYCRWLPLCLARNQPSNEINFIPSRTFILYFSLADEAKDNKSTVCWWRWIVGSTILYREAIIITLNIGYKFPKETSSSD